MQKGSYTSRVAPLVVCVCMCVYVCVCVCMRISDLLLVELEDGELQSAIRLHRAPLDAR